VAWPVGAVLPADANPEDIIGFEMPYAGDQQSLINVYNPNARVSHDDYGSRLRIARNLCWAMDSLHAAGVIAGDLNESNVLVGRDTLITLIDADSFQIRDSNETLFCEVARPEYLAPELHGVELRTAERHTQHDSFALAVMVFKLLVDGNHPFSGRYTGRGTAPTLEQKIVRGWYPYGKRGCPYLKTRTGARMELLHPEVKRLMDRCFVEGHVDSHRRPTAAEFREALDLAERDKRFLRRAGAKRSVRLSGDKRTMEELGLWVIGRLLSVRKTTFVVACCAATVGWMVGRSVSTKDTAEPAAVEREQAVTEFSVPTRRLETVNEAKRTRPRDSLEPRHIKLPTPASWPRSESESAGGEGALLSRPSGKLPGVSPRTLPFMESVNKEQSDVTGEE